MADPSPPARRAPLIHFGHPDSHLPLFEPPNAPSKKASRLVIVLLFVVGLAAAWLCYWFESVSHSVAAPDIALPWVIPFVLLLLSIAIFPFVARHFWEKNYQWVSLALAATVAIYYLTGVPQGYKPLAKSLAEYISFICLLGSLFIVSGGILIRVRRRATPAVNVTLLLTGALLANVLGTTGASMLLIRPYLRINRGHIRPFHIVFFIFIVSNLGGSLTPIGDPPLFLGYLKGVPFWWVLEHCWPMTAAAVGTLLAIFFILDLRAHAKEPRAPHDARDLGPAISIYGASNLLFIALILAGVFIDPPGREAFMVLAACGSLWTTERRIHVENVFNFAPIREVALLFIGLFATMVPALNYLSRHAEDARFKSLLNTPGQYYFSTGALSSVLDNAPTYLTFLEAEVGKIDKNTVSVAADVVNNPHKESPDQADYFKLWKLNEPSYLEDPERYSEHCGQLENAVAALKKYRGEKVRGLTPDEINAGFLLGDPGLNWTLIAISLGAVFFGAMTYIGNGPNFMVRSIAETSGVKCPSFFGYICAYSLPILLPILILVWAIFLWH